MTRLLCVLVLVLVGAMTPCQADDRSPPTFLVAREGLPDPNFGNSVVLLTQIEGQGAFGLIVNKPTPVALAKLFPDLPRLAKLDDKVFFGGPVSMQAVSFLYRSSGVEDNSLEVMKGLYLSTDTNYLHELLSREKPIDGLRVFIGYSGWGPGQLESEMSRGDWHRVDADARWVFEHKPESLWHDLDFKASATKAFYRLPR